jgi:hypothetical protein
VHSYVEGLERRVKELEERLRRASSSDSTLVGLPPHASSGEGADADSDAWSDQSESDNEFTFVQQGFENLQVGALGRTGANQASTELRGFLGKSCSLRLVREVERLSSGSLTDGHPFFSCRPEFRRVTPGLFDDVNSLAAPLPWPEPDLAEALIDAYFSSVNIVLPILHKPTFMREWKDPRFRRDRGWTGLAFSIFAVASKFIDDPRVLEAPEREYRHSAGVQYWMQARSV